MIDWIGILTLRLIRYVSMRMMAYSITLNDEVGGFFLPPPKAFVKGIHFSRNCLFYILVHSLYIAASKKYQELE